MNIEFIVDSGLGGEDAKMLKQALETYSNRVEFPPSWLLKKSDNNTEAIDIVPNATENGKLCNGDEEMTQEQPQVDSTAQALSEQPPKQLNPDAAEFVPKLTIMLGVDAAVSIQPKTMSPKLAPNPQKVSPRPGYQINGHRRDLPIYWQPPPFDQQLSMPPMVSLANVDSLNSTYMSNMVPIHAVTSYQEPHQPTTQAPHGHYFQQPLVPYCLNNARHRPYIPLYTGPVPYHNPSGPYPENSTFGASDSLPGTHMGGMLATYSAVPPYIGGHPGACVNMGGQPGVNMGGHPVANMGGHPVANMGGYPVTNMGGHPVANMGGHPVANMGSHPVASMGGVPIPHPIVPPYVGGLPAAHMSGMHTTHAAAHHMGSTPGGHMSGMAAPYPVATQYLGNTSAAPLRIVTAPHTANMATSAPTPSHFTGASQIAPTPSQLATVPPPNIPWLMSSPYRYVEPHRTCVSERHI